jgi:trimeric autotransporter adhesin
MRCHLKGFIQCLILIVIPVFSSCRKEEVPTLTTLSVFNISSSRAESGGIITDEGIWKVRTRGVCWSTNPKPTISDFKSVDGDGAGSFDSRLTSLNEGTVYYVRAYATNSSGTGYGNEITFRTITPTVPLNGLVAYYPFNGNASDQISNSNYGTVNGASPGTDRFGFPNSAYYFDGVNNMITGKTYNWPTANSARTISIWVKLSSLPANGEDNLLISYGTETAHNLNDLYFQNMQEQGKRIFFGGYFDDIYCTYDYSINTWYNVTGTFDGTIARLYINSELKAEGNKSGWNTINSDFHFGGWYNSKSFIHGTLDDIRIYNRELTQEEILMLYNEIP